MKKTFLKTVFVISALFAGSAVANAQIPISFSGHVGYAAPQGSWFENADGERMSRFGIGFDFDILYHLPQTNYRLGVGLTYNTSILFGADLGEGLDIGLYGLALYGVKGQWRFFNSRVSPFAALSLGLSHFATPEISTIDGAGNSTVIVPSENAFGFGIRPEVGVEFGWFVMSVGYTVPMSYSISDVSDTAGALQFNIGARISLFDRR